jgi:hypothetical protein
MQPLKEGYKLIDGQIRLVENDAQGGQDWSSARRRGWRNRALSLSLLPIQQPLPYNAGSGLVWLSHIESTDIFFDEDRADGHEI